MRSFNTPRSEILEYQGDMLKVLARHKNGGYSKEKLGYLVKFYGGNKVLMSDNTLIICEVLEDAILEEL